MLGSVRSCTLPAAAWSGTSPARARLPARVASRLASIPWASTVPGPPTPLRMRQHRSGTPRSGNWPSCLPFPCTAPKLPPISGLLSRSAGFIDRQYRLGIVQALLDVVRGFFSFKSTWRTLQGHEVMDLARSYCGEYASSTFAVGTWTWRTTLGRVETV